MTAVFPLSEEQLIARHDFIPDKSVPADEQPPVPQSKSKHSPRHHATIGYCTLPIVLITAALAFNSFEQSASFSGVCSALAAIFGWFCYSLIREPAAWQQKLRSFTIDSTLNIQYEGIDTETGNIYLTQSGKVSGTMRQLFSNNIQINDILNTSNPKAPLSGFFHVRNGRQICQLLRQQQNHK